MRITCRSWPVASAAVVLLSSAVALSAQETALQPARALSCDDIETFLKTAKLGRQREIPIGATVPLRTTLDNGTLRHDAAIQITDVSLASYTTPRGTEINFRDSWKFNVAGVRAGQDAGTEHGAALRRTPGERRACIVVVVGGRHDDGAGSGPEEAHAARRRTLE